MTYLQMVNAVMRKLREDEASTINETDYSRLLGDFVNDAKKYVEDSWDWSVLRDTYTLNTVEGIDTYTLTGLDPRCEILYANNESNFSPVKKDSLQNIKRKTLGTDTEGSAMTFAVSGTDSNNNLKVRIYPTPDVGEQISFEVVKRTPDLEDDADTTKLPSSVIVHFAYSYALVERGETGGQSGSEQAIFAKAALTDAITLDARLFSDELIWETV